MAKRCIMRRLFSVQMRSKGKYLVQKNISRSTATTGPMLPQPQPHQGVTLLKEKVNQGMLIYEDFIGIRQVKEAQDRVLSAEKSFKASQQARRAAQEKLTEVQNQLRVLRMDIDRTARGDNRYLELIKNEIDIIREEREVRSSFEELEGRERELFAELSNALRMNHEKERAQGEKTKYWSVGASLVGAFFGILGTTFNTRMRHQQTKDILLQTSAHVSQIEDSVQALTLRLGVEPLPNANNNNPVQNSDNVARLVATVQEQEKLLRISVDTLLSVTKTVESIALQLHTNIERRNDRDPVYIDISEVTPSTISDDHGAIVATLLLLAIGAIMFIRY